MKSLGLRIAVSMLLGMSGAIQAGELWCSGTLKTIYVNTAGDVFIGGTWRSAYTMICNLHNAWNGVPPETCPYWYSLMAASKTHGKYVLVYYPNTSATCATLPTYGSAPGPGYVMQQDPT